MTTPLTREERERLTQAQRLRAEADHIQRLHPLIAQDIDEAADTIDSLEERVRELGALRDHFFDQAQRFDHDFNVQMARAEGAEARIALLEEVLRDVVEAEWMVTHDWGGDREAVLGAARAALDQKGEQK